MSENIPMTPSEIEPAAFRFVVQCLNYLSHRTLPSTFSTKNISWSLREAGAWDWQPYHFRMPIVLKFGSLSLLEHSGPAQAWSGIALPFALPLYTYSV